MSAYSWITKHAGWKVKGRVDVLAKLGIVTQVSLIDKFGFRSSFILAYFSLKTDE